jgi:hypothetical protein
MNTTGINKSGFKPGQATKITRINKLADLNATPVVAEVEAEVVASDELEVTEITQ